MLERFTADARAVVTQAVVEARAARAERGGTEHLLLGLLTRTETTATQALARHGLDLARARGFLAKRQLGPVADDLDPDALAAIGIDLEAVRASVEASFGEGTLDAPAGQGLGRRRSGHVPFSPRAKKVLELALREAVRLTSRSITDVHLLLGLLREGEGLAAVVLRDAGIDLAQLRADLERDLRQAG